MAEPGAGSAANPNTLSVPGLIWPADQDVRTPYVSSMTGPSGVEPGRMERLEAVQVSMGSQLTHYECTKFANGWPETAIQRGPWGLIGLNC